MGPKAKEDEFFVEVIVAAKVVAVSDSEDGEPAAKTRKKKRKRASKPQATPTWIAKEYLVKWLDYDDSENSWEPASNLRSCSRLLNSFWSVVAENEGADKEDQDHHIGDMVKPPREWIEREKKRFAKEQKEARRAKEGNTKKKKRSSTKEKPKEKEEAQKPSTSSGKAGRRKKAYVIDTDSDSDPDVPLAKKHKQNESVKLADELLPESPQPTDPKDPKKRKRSEEPKIPPLPTKYIAMESTPPNSIFSEVESSPMFNLGAKPPPPPLPHNPTLPPLPVRTAPTAITSHVPNLPTRAKHTLNPHTKLVAMPQDPGPSNSGISTKQRLAAGALAPTLPKNMSSAAPKPKGPPLAPVRTGSSSMMTTGFKKSSQISPVFPHHEPTLASLNAPLASPTIASILPEMQIAQSPVALDQGQSFDGESSGFDLGTQTQVDDFLKSIMPPQLAGPLEPAPEIPAEPRPAPAFVSKVPALSTRHTKPFKWEGNLLVTTDGTDTAFKIIIEDESDVKLMGFSFSILLHSFVQLQVRHLYHLHDLCSILPACQTPNQFAKVSLPPAENKKQWSVLLRYLTKSKKVVLIPLRLDGNVVAHLLLAPPRLTLPSSIRIPPQIRVPDCLAASILTWSLTPGQIVTESRLELAKLPDTKSKFQAPMSNRPEGASDVRRLESLKQSLKTRPLFHEAVRVLDFPAKIFDYLQQTSRPWAICPPHTPGNPKNLVEVELMKSILSRIKEEALTSQRENHASKNRYPVLREAHTPEIAQMLFIHVGALQHLNQLSWLRDRVTSPDYVRFYTFGSHPSVYSSFWGVQEIYPCGGVVTFLPSSFLLYPYETMQLIKKINEHPFWTMYILPSVLGMVAHLSGTDGAPTINGTPHSYLLKAIEDGQIALIEAPPDNKFCFGEPASDRRHRWFHDYLSGLPPSEEEALSLARSAFGSKSANVAQAQWQAMIEREVAEDLARMQRQPVFMLDYRRYVALTGTSVRRRDSLEWLLPNELSFKDAFLQD